MGVRYGAWPSKVADRLAEPSGTGKASQVIKRKGKVVVQFAVAAVSDRRNLLNQKTAVRDRRHNESNCTTTKGKAGLTGPQQACRFEDILLILIEYNFACRPPVLPNQRSFGESPLRAGRSPREA